MGRLFGASEEVPVAVSYPPHAITQRFNVMTAYPLARSVTPASGGAGGRTAQAIVETSRSSWAESDLKSVLTGRPVKMEESGGDKQGPVAIAAAVSAPVGAGRPPAEPRRSLTRRSRRPGSSSSATRTSRPMPRPASQGNVDLFMNTVGWLSQQENLISVRPEGSSRPPDHADGSASRRGSTGSRSPSSPACIFGTGIMRWWRRR